MKCTNNILSGKISYTWIYNACYGNVKINNIKIYISLVKTLNYIELLFNPQSIYKI